VQFLTASGRVLYGISTVLAFLTGLMPFAILLSAAAFAGAHNLFTLVIWLITGTWLICNLIPIIFLGSRNSLASVFATVGSSVVFVFCGYALFVSITHDVADPLYFTSPIPMWAWLTIPFLFNAVQAVLSTLRYQQLSTLR
jgi:hypothetical protein